MPRTAKLLSCQAGDSACRLDLPMEAPVEIRYAGVVIGRAQEVKDADGDSPFLLVREPMPVGTVVQLRSGGDVVSARVMNAIESADASASGMRVHVLAEAEIANRDFIPPPGAALEKPAARVPLPIGETEPTLAAQESKSAQPAQPEPTELVRANETTSAVPASAESPAQPVDSPAETSASPADPEAPPAETAPDPAVPVVVENRAVRETMPYTVGMAEGVHVVVSVASANAVGAAVPEPAPAKADSAAVQEAVPVAVGSSMTGALRNATGTVEVEASGETDGEASENAGGDSEAATSKPGDLPPAKPIAGPSARRKTKRRRYQHC